MVTIVCVRVMVSLNINLYHLMRSSGVKMQVYRYGNYEPDAIRIEANEEERKRLISALILANRWLKSKETMILVDQLLAELGK